MKRITLILIVITGFVIYSCSDESFEEMDLESPSATQSNLLQSQYDFGLSIGRNDAANLIDDSFYLGFCYSDDQIPNDFGECYYPINLGVTNQFIVDYNANLDQLIMSTTGAEEAKQIGIKDGFNMGVCTFGITYGFGSFCGYPIIGSPANGEGPGGPGPGGPGSGDPGPGDGDLDPIDGGCGEQFDC